MAMNAIFVAGTDTGIGKTFICAQLLAYLKNRDIKAGYQKWVSTGDAGLPADLQYCLAVAGLPFDPSLLDLQVPFRFRFPASPHLAAALENRIVDPEVIACAYTAFASRVELLIVEGVGGLLVPLGREFFLIDLVARLAPPVLLVATSGLGTLNHTLLSLEALRSRNIVVLGVVFTDSAAAEDERLIADNMKTIADLGKVTVFGRMPRIGGADAAEQAAAAFAPIGRQIVAAW